jgi:hypothetical protein
MDNYDSTLPQNALSIDFMKLWALSITKSSMKHQNLRPLSTGYVLR